MSSKYLKITCAEVKIGVADVTSNCEKMVKKIAEAWADDSQIITFPELSLCGYSCGDMFFNESLHREIQESLEKIRQHSVGMDIITVVGAPLRWKNCLYNCAVVIQDGAYIGVVPKYNLAVGQDRDENRWFTSAAETEETELFLGNGMVPFGPNLLFVERKHGVTFGVELGEDMCGVIPKASILAATGAQVILNISSAAETVGDVEGQKLLLKQLSASAKCIYAYNSGSVGESTTDMLFSSYKGIYEDGNHLVENDFMCGDELTASATVDIAMIEAVRNRMWKMVKSNRNIGGPVRELEIHMSCQKNKEISYGKEPFLLGMTPDIVCQRISKIQQKAILKKMEYMKRNKVILGISGGLDSTVALLALVEAYKMAGINTKNIIGVTMPGPGTSKNTYQNSLDLMKYCGISALDIDINAAVEAHLKAIGQPEGKYDITYEQTQSRERTKILMDLANKENGIVIGTGDMSELALGWMSYSGDQLSMYAINAGIPKTIIRYLADWYYKNSEGDLQKVLGRIMDTPISPELLPLDETGKQKQETENLVGPYKVHDFFLYYVLKYGLEFRHIQEMAIESFKDEYTAEQIKAWMNVFVGRFFTRQYKRSCFPDGIQVYDISLSPRSYWRMPSDVSDKLWKTEVKEEK